MLECTDCHAGAPVRRLVRKEPLAPVVLPLDVVRVVVEQLDDGPLRALGSVGHPAVHKAVVVNRCPPC
eukprot:8099302-Pyramimonas_sp.AAC.1